VKDRREEVHGQLIIAAAGSVSTLGGDKNTGYIDKQEKGIAALQVLVADAVASVLFIEASIDKTNWYQVEGRDGALIYSDRSAVSGTRWWTVDEDIFACHYVRLASMTSTGGTAGSALAAGGTFTYMGFS
jgi:hypothetical protein